MEWMIPPQKNLSFNCCFRFFFFLHRLRGNECVKFRVLLCFPIHRARALECSEALGVFNSGEFILIEFRRRSVVKKVSRPNQGLIILITTV